MALLKIIILRIIDLIILVLNMNIKAYAFINFQNIKGHECNKSSLLKHVKKDNELSVILNFLEKKFALICLINEQRVYSFPCMHRYKNNLNSWFAK